MHLLGTFVLGFLLLPLAFSCKNTNNKEAISKDYKYIIAKQLEEITHSIEIQLKNKTCVKRIPTMNIHPIQQIYNISCNRLLRSMDGLLERELTSLVNGINESLGCPCQTHQAVRPSKQPPLKKKLCKLKHLLDRIKEAYEKHNSTA